MLTLVGVAACGGRTDLPVPLPPCPARSFDCDHDSGNGCEVDLATDDESCGACGEECPDGLSCADGTCVPGDTIVQIESMVSTVFVRTADGRVLTWGWNQYGMANPRSDAEIIWQPEQLELPERVVEIRRANLSTCARGVSGRVWCWGSSSQIPGASASDASQDFVAVAGVEGARVLMGATDGHCVFDAHARALCWSDNGDDELSTGAGHPVPLSPPTAIEMSAIAGPQIVTLFPSLAAVEDGSVLTWGNVDSLGRPPPQPAAPVLEPGPVPGLIDPVRVDAGYRSYCANLANGQVWCWGPELHPDLNYDPFLAFEQGPYKRVSVSGYLCALDHSGRVRCNHEHNKYSAGVDRDGVADLAAGVYHVCLLMQDQRVLCKGSNNSGQLGVEAVEHADRLTEVPLANLL